MTMPDFVTFTGFDNYTDLEEMEDLDRHYPIEWGVLFSPKHQGEGRYPSASAVFSLIGSKVKRLSAHLCGQHSRDLIQTGIAPGMSPVLNSRRFGRIQVNTAQKELPIRFMADWTLHFGARLVLQCRTGFPTDDRCDWLFDCSGGRGERPAFWPISTDSTLVGYAGGIAPDTLKETIEMTRQSPSYWLDMESGVRTDDQFDLEKCRQVCEALWGKP